MASIEPRRNKDGKITSYLIAVTLGRDEAGNKIRETTSIKAKDLKEKTPAKQRKEVEDFAREFENAVKDGSAFTSGDRITFAQFVKDWDDNSLTQKVLSGTLTRSVKESYISTLNYHVVPYIGHMKLNQIKATHIDRIVTCLLNEGKKPATIRNVFGCVRSCFNYAVRKDIVRENPCMRCEPLPVIRRDGELHTFTEDQVRRFLTEALYLEYEIPIKGHTRSYSEIGDGRPFKVKDYTEHKSVPLQWRVYFTLAVFGGFRRGEMIGLNWEDIDPETQTITIRKAVSLSDDGQYIKNPKTEAGKRTIRVPEICFKLLGEWQTEQKRICMKLGSAWEGQRGRDFKKNPVFIQTDTGKRMNLQSPTKKFHKILKAYNKTVPEADQLPLIRLHDLRHTNASHLVASGVDFETIARRLGHSKPSFTLDVYGHALPENDEKASDKLEEIFTKTS